MHRFSVVVVLIAVIIVLLLIWQMYGVHHGKMNETQGVNRIVITAPINNLSE
jgi:hypothetical protein